MDSKQDRIRAAKAAYARRYRKEHPERIKAAQLRYWEKFAEREEATKHAETKQNG